MKDQKPLLPCPFCGNKGCVGSVDNTFYVTCCNCFVEVYPYTILDSYGQTNRWTKEEAIHAWNTRALPSKGCIKEHIGQFGQLGCQCPDCKSKGTDQCNKGVEQVSSTPIEDKGMVEKECKKHKSSYEYQEHGDECPYCKKYPCACQCTCGAPKQPPTLYLTPNAMGSFSLVADMTKPNVVFATFYKREDAEMVLRLLSGKDGSSAPFSKLIKIAQECEDAYQSALTQELLEEVSKLSAKPELQKLDFQTIWVEFEKFLEPHTCDLIIKPHYARNAEHCKTWLKSVCDRYAAPQTELVPLNWQEVFNIIVQEGNYPKDPTWSVDRICSKFGSPKPSVPTVESIEKIIKGKITSVYGGLVCHIYGFRKAAESVHQLLSKEMK